MINRIRKSKVSKVVASYLAIQMIVQMSQPMQLFALTSGPSQPEFNSFTPIGTSDMVNLSSGNFNYNIPIMDVGGYPLNLAYDSGVTMDQEASWVGLGWNLNVGQINRQVRGIPDDFKGDLMEYENNMRNNVTVGIDTSLDPQVFGLETPDGASRPQSNSDSNAVVSIGMGFNYNNYTGISFKPSFGIQFALTEGVTVGIEGSSSATDGATISPFVNAKLGNGSRFDSAVGGTLNAGVSYNSNRGLTSFNMSAALNFDDEDFSQFQKDTDVLTGFGSISFVNPTWTPRKRAAFTDISGTVAVSVGGDIWGLDGEFELSAMGSIQKLKDPFKIEKAYGYEFTGFAEPNDILDYNREKDQLIGKNTLALPTSTYTYDLYSVQGQGIAGMFRPFRSQVGQINDEFVQDNSDSFSLGLEIEPGSGQHVGLNFTNAPSTSHTGVWNTNAINYFKQTREDANETGDSLNYEHVYFKYIGEPLVDKDQQLFEKLGAYAPIAFNIKGNKKRFDKYADSQFYKKEYSPDNTHTYTNLPRFTSKFKRKNRDVRNQNVQKITKKELKSFYEKSYYKQRANPLAKDHHTAEIRVQNADGSTYVFGETAYNKTKKEVTFTTNSNTYNCATGLVTYNGGENTRGNKSGIDHFFNSMKTPEYAHTYLLSSVFSSDYEDINDDGPTDDDLGAYTSFIYKKKNADDIYKWRIPYSKELNQASYNAGLNTSKSDQKGSYIYGEKEIKYIDKIVTKTHVAIFDLSPREDARGAASENGGIPSAGKQQMYKIDKIRLYSKPEAIRARILDDKDSNDLPITAIKTAHFFYDYSQCKGVENNFGLPNDIDDHELANQGGKLTLKKVYFTYRNSEMGKYTPYTFNYGTGGYVDGTWIQDAESNPNYNLKAYDIWGNYKPNADGGCNTKDPITAPEFPFVQQEDKALQDTYASAWSLTSIDLPSGGRIDMEYESDDYESVQNRDAMQMFKVVGAGRFADENLATIHPEANQKLYKMGGLFSNKDATHLYVKLPKETEAISSEVFKQKYLKGVDRKPIYFRFMMNMTKAAALSDNSSNYDYVTGYLEIGGSVNTFKANNAIYAAIPMKTVDMEGGVQGKRQVNPISKAGWYFGRQYLNGLIYGLNMDYRSENLESIAKNLVSSVAAMADLVKGPNSKLRSNEFLCAQRFIPEKSWIRLSSPENKLGGGVRVKRLVMKDQWKNMVDVSIDDPNKLYDKEYGQTYEYTTENGISSGVATYEPNQSKENPFVEPFYNKPERLVAPRQVNYVEKPFGEAYFPNAAVTYSRITVRNLAREGIKKHATGRVVTEYFTSKDFPTWVDYTNINAHMATNENAFLKNILKGLVGAPISTKTEYTLSQGFVVHTNDMNAKMRFQKVYAEEGSVPAPPGKEEPISSVEYIYSTEEGDDTKLNNTLPVIGKNGRVYRNRQIGVDYDVINDFRESYSKSETIGHKGNIVILIIGVFPIPVPMVVPSKTTMENVAHSAITTKAIHTTAVLKEKIATDIGSRVSTVNEAWDAETGQVLLTRTVNEFDDEYYNFNFPAYWSYEGMAQASKNIGITGTLQKSGQFFTTKDAKKYFTLGDEIIASYGFNFSERLWVVGFNGDGNGVMLMNKNGAIVNKSDGVAIDQPIRFKIVRSGHRNQQTANMGAITMMKNPIKDASGGDLERIDTSTFSLDANTPAAENMRIVNASAVEYKDFWNCQCEDQLPFIARALQDKTELSDVSQEDYPFEPVQFNPYLYNAKGEWRAKRSYAYLTERTNVNEGTTSVVDTRREGYFKKFTPYYAKTIAGDWQKANTADADWTFASEVTQYGPYGVELENQDALGRYSSAQYGYNFTLPTGVSSNSSYSDMGADNFEDYTYQLSRDQAGKFDSEAHFNFKKSADDDGIEKIRISEEVSHTGRTSLLVPGNQKAELVRHLQGELEPDTNYDNDKFPNVDDKCPYTPSSNADYDLDGIGDECDDDPVPQITNVELLEGIYRVNGTFCNGIRTRFTIHGNPNDIVPYTVSVLHFEERGFGAYVNNKLVVATPYPDTYVSTEETSIRLDVTGKAVVLLDLGILNRKSRKRDNEAVVSFGLIHKGTNGPLFNEAENRLETVNLGWKSRFKKCHGGNSNRWIPVSSDVVNKDGWNIYLQ